MSKTFVDDLPAKYRDVYKNIKISPKTSALKFKTLNEMEVLKNKTRETSNIYKLLGENLFGIMTMDNYLHLDVELYTKSDLVNLLAREIELSEISKEIMSKIPDGQVEVKHNDAIAKINYITNDVVVQIDEAINALTEATEHLSKMFTSEEIGVQEYMNSNNRENVKAIVKMYTAISNRSITMTQTQYFYKAIKTSPVYTSVRRIHWPSEFYTPESK